MPSDLRPSQWRQRAEELRATGESMIDDVARKTLLDTASQWDRMADQLERLLTRYSDDARKR